jgi:hypothetical protein
MTRVSWKEEKRERMREGERPAGKEGFWEKPCGDKRRWGLPSSRSRRVRSPITASSKLWPTTTRLLCPETRLSLWVSADAKMSGVECREGPYLV